MRTLRLITALLICMLLPTMAVFCQSSNGLKQNIQKIEALHQSALLALSKADSANAIQYASDALFLADSFKQVPAQISLNIWLSGLFVAQQDYAFAIEHELNCITLLKTETDTTQSIEKSYQRLGELYLKWHEMEGNGEAGLLALEHEKEHELLKKNNLLLEREHELQKIKLREEQELRFFWIGISLLVVLLCCALFFGYWKNVQAKNELRITNTDILNKTEEIEAQRDQIEAKGKEVEVALQELKNQRYLLHQQNERLHQAQGTIEEQNIKLKTSNVVLEEKVRLRTTELEASFQEVLKLNRQLDHYSYRSAHDLKGPIARILGLCQVGLMENSQEGLVSCMIKLQDTAQRMGKLVDRIINGLNIKTKQLEITEVTLSGIVNEVITELGFAEMQDIKLNVASLPEQKVYSDAYLLKVLFQNLIQNSLDYKDCKKETPYISLTIHKVGRKNIELHLRDNGCGIDSKIQDKVFGMFYKGSELSDGAGLGLYEAKLIAEKLGGEISLVQSDNTQTIFSVKIPINLEQEATTVTQKLYSSKEEQEVRRMG